jgi:hypothetical protein
LEEALDLSSDRILNNNKADKFVQCEENKDSSELTQNTSVLYGQTDN